MITCLFPLKFDWPRQIAWVRVLLAAAALGICYFYPLHAAPVLFFYGLLVLYLVLSLIVVVRGARPGGLLGLLARSATRSASWLWLASAPTAYGWLPFFSFIFWPKLWRFTGRGSGMVVAVAAVFCAILPYDGTRGVLVAGALTCGCAVHKRRLKSHRAF